MKKIALLLTFMLFAVSAIWAQGETKTDTVRHQVMLQTTKGNIVVELYNETPRHRDNFLKVVRSGYYDGILFHRVIADFMIQAGDSTSRHAKPGAPLGDYDLIGAIPYPRSFAILCISTSGVLWLPRESPTASTRNGLRGALIST